MATNYPANFEKSTKRVSGIYSITHAESGKTYIGSSASIFRRWRGHFIFLEADRHGNRYLQSAWAKHGSAAFSFSVLEVCAPEKLTEREQAHIDAVPEDSRYNLSPVAGSVLGMNWDLSPETKATMSRARRLLTDGQIAEAKELYLSGWTYKQLGERYGVSYGPIHSALRGRLLVNSSEPVVGVVRRKRTAETREKMSVAGKARAPLSPETREKIRAAMKGRVFSDAWRAKLSATAKNRTYTEDGRAKIGAAKREFYVAHPEALGRLADMARNRTPETRAKLAGWERTPELRAKMSAAHKGKPWTAAQRAGREAAQAAKRMASQI